MRGVQTGIICRCENQSAVCADVGHGVERVACHIDTDHFHRCHSAHAADGGTDGNLHGNFLVRSPLCVDFRVFYDIFTNFGAGRSGVRAGDLDTGFISTAGNRFIAQHDFGFAHLLIPFFSLYNIIVNTLITMIVKKLSSVNLFCKIYKNFCNEMLANNSTSVLQEREK